MKKKISGIYAIVCSGTWRSYIGSSNDLDKRKETHFRLLKQNKHDNKELQQDYNQFGLDSFYWKIIEETEDIRLIERENFWISQGCNLYNTYQFSDCFEFTQEEKDRFWSWINIGKESECWNWIGAKDKDGYGRIGFRRNKKKKMFRSNRLAYFLSKKDWNKDLVVCHKCDNPSCCNPNHLFLGSLSDNAKDRTKKNRGTNKLNHEIANKLRQKYLENKHISSKELIEFVLKEYNLKVSHTSINKILNNKNFYNPNYQVFSRKDYRISNLKQNRKAA